MLYSETSTLPLLLLLLLLLLCLSRTRRVEANNGTGGGQWQLLLNSSGVVAMHMAVTHRNTVLMFDQTTFGQSGYRLRHHRTRHCSSDKPDCWAHSVEYNISSNSVRPLILDSDTWCSSGSFLSDGTLAQTGGYHNGSRKVRYFRPCRDRNCDWRESTRRLRDRRWYSSDQILPEKDRVIVVGGLDAFTYEFVPKSLTSIDDESDVFHLPLLSRTRSRRDHGGNLYPFLHLSSDGNLFVFANRDSVLLDYKRKRVIKTFPRIPGDGPRNYPATGSSVMLELDYNDVFKKVEILVCGGGATGAYRAAQEKRFIRALSSCGRMVITAKDPKWVMEEMPEPRVMADMIILPTGHILIINGAKSGSAGWHSARNPSFHPYLYKPNGTTSEERFHLMTPSTIPRLYHSSAVLLPDGRVLIAGSNPNRHYTYSNVRFPTELRVEAFIPHYMNEAYDDKRATNVSVSLGHGRYGIGYGEEFNVRFRLSTVAEAAVLAVKIYAPPFATHSISMNQRMLKLRCGNWTVDERSGEIKLSVTSPPSPVAAPSGYYMLTVVNCGVPSKAIWIRLVQ